MPPIVLAMVAVAAVIHATWNVILKTSGDPLRTSARAMVGGVIVGLPLAVAAYVATGAPPVPSEAILLGVLSGCAETAYFVLLSTAYRHGDLSVVYPVARGTAPLFAVSVGVVVLGDRLGPLGAIGVAALTIGILVIQRPWRALVPRRAHAGPPTGDRAVDRAVVYALLTGVAIASYSAVDSVGVRIVQPWVFAAIAFPVNAVTLVLWVRFVDRTESVRGRPIEPPAPWGRATLAGTLSLAGYMLILGAYVVAPLTVIAPLREAAVVLGSAWGSFRLGEAVSRGDGGRRVAGALCVLAGAVLVAVGA
ncbi:MAG TPA: DMT family transporter [Candidatus Limnocylindrales bacterium]